ncbi:MAG: 3'(2'),5'-bisphosphate nucleotidase CysQ [Acidimicrobiales bacterium]
MTDHELAAAVATEAGRLLCSVRAELGDADPRLLRNEGDKRAHDRICELLARDRPDDAVLSEEAADDPARLSSARVWIVDPLDGTREFSEPPRTDWAVHVALWADDDLVAGAVALPAQELTLWTGEAPTLPPASAGPLRLVVSRTRPPALVEALVELLGAELVPMGSAGAKAMAVVAGEADAYVHAGGQYEWDSAAPVAVARAAGLHTSRVDGSALRYNRADPRLPDLVICRPELASDLLQAVAKVSTVL